MAVCLGRGQVLAKQAAQLARPHEGSAHRADDRVVAHFGLLAASGGAQLARLLVVARTAAADTSEARQHTREVRRRKKKRAIEAHVRPMCLAMQKHSLACVAPNELFVLAVQATDRCDVLPAAHLTARTKVRHCQSGMRVANQKPGWQGPEQLEEPSPADAP